MTKRYLILVVALAALLLAPSAGATLRMYGSDVRPRHWNWAKMAQANVPLPNARIKLYSGYDAQYISDLHELYLPQPGKLGWDYKQERVLFIHELGHVFDFNNLDDAERTEWKLAAGTLGGWWDKENIWTRWDGWATKLAPGEMFAEQYAACAYGRSRREMNNGGFVTYGWEPPIGTDTALCALIRGFND